MENDAVNALTNPAPRHACRGLSALVLVLAAGLPVMAQDQPNSDAAQAQAEKAAAERREQEGQEAALAEKMKAAQGAGANTGAAGAGRTGSQPSAAGRTGAFGSQSGGRQPGEAAGLRIEGDGQQPGGPGMGSMRAAGPDEVTLSAFSGPIELKTLVEIAAEVLQINIVASDQLTGSVVLNAPVTVKKTELLRLLSSLLEQQSFMITRDDTGWYKVLPTDNVILAPRPLGAEGELTTTRVIPTPTVKASSLAQAITDQLGVANKPQRISYMDELGVIVATDSPRRLDALSSLVAEILGRHAQVEWTRMELRFVAPAVARQRLLDMLGVASGTPGAIVINQPGQAAAQGGQATANITNIGDRLIADPSGNQLIFRGFPEEIARVEEMLAYIDRPNTLRYAKYFAGSGATQIAQLAERLGLGHVEVVDGSNTSPNTNTTGTQTIQFQQGNNRGPVVVNQGQQQAQPIGGPVMIVDTIRASIIYYGTDQQHNQLADLISKFDTELEQVVIASYKIKNRLAYDVADVLNGIAFNQSPSGSGSEFLPGGGGFFNNLNRQFGGNQTGTTQFGGARNTGTNRNTGSNRNTRQQGNTGFQPFRGTFQPGTNSAAQANPSDPSALGGPDVFILADQGNNIVIVKAPAQQQEEFARIIAKLDQRTPQVYIEVQIVAVTATKDFRLAFETQLVNAGGTGGALNTNFGLGSLTTTTGGTTPTTSGGFTSPKNVATGLGGLTSAVIKSDYVPIVMNALQSNTDSRILASPHLLVDDNVEAEIISVEEQPTSATSQGTSSTVTNFGGYEQAGTRLTVTPSISEGGYMRLMYDIELSNFVGTGGNGFPAPKQTRNIRSDSVTVPGDTTIVVGGITLDQKGLTIAKVPLLGDIPLIGHLFRDHNANDTSPKLYVFITPRIFRDQNFRDPILYTRGPAKEAGITLDYPELKPARVELVGPAAPKGPAMPEPTPKIPPKKQESIRLWPDKD
jgi:type II secretory pathway component GspD/PulD (secretin)